MYAIVEISGQQFKVEKDNKIFVHRLEAKEGDKIDFDQVFLIDDGKNVNIGSPSIKNAKVTAKVIEHLKGDKVIVFKKKRRKGYKVKNGHRQYLTKLEILKIDNKSIVKKKEIEKDNQSLKKESKVKKTVAKKTTAKKTVAKKTTSKKTVAKKTTAKKAVAKKTTSEKTEKK
tara:strand:- start:12741 stop:13256 length:516 start_codon:yes stop_codon:yes gene_type:complete